MYYHSQLLTAAPFAGCCAGGTIGVVHSLVFVKSSKPLLQRLQGYGVPGAASGGLGLSPLTDALLLAWSDLALQPGPVPRVFHPKLTSRQDLIGHFNPTFCGCDKPRRGVRSREGTALSSRSPSSAGQQKL